MTRRPRRCLRHAATEGARAHTSAFRPCRPCRSVARGGRLRGVVPEVHLPGRVTCSRSRQRLGSQAEVGQDLLHERRVGEGREDAHPGAAARAPKRVETEGALQETAPSTRDAVASRMRPPCFSVMLVGSSSGSGIACAAEAAVTSDAGATVAVGAGCGCGAGGASHAAGVLGDDALVGGGLWLAHGFGVLRRATLSGGLGVTKRAPGRSSRAVQSAAERSRSAAKRFNRQPIERAGQRDARATCRRLVAPPSDLSMTCRRPCKGLEIRRNRACRFRRLPQVCGKSFGRKTEG